MMANRNITKTNTVQEFAHTYNATAQDMGDIGDLNKYLYNTTPTDIVEAVRTKMGRKELLKWIFVMTNDVE